MTKMKLILIIVSVVWFHNREVSCFRFTDYFSEKMDIFTSSVSGFAEKVSEKMKRVTNEVSSLYHTIVDKFNSLMPSFQYANDDELLNRMDASSKRVKIAFSDFVAEEAAKSETESPEYFSLRSDPTALMSTPQLAALHGKRIESHVVVTNDGYLLTLHRLRTPFSVQKKNEVDTMNYTILMHHGLLGSSADWILLGPEKSLPYILSNAGCDVWFMNARGNYYSRGHITFKVNSLDYWNFTWEQMGTNDLPAVVEYIKKIKNSTEQLNFIGHSMGATAFLVMLSVFPHFNKYFRMGILLAPLAYMSNIKGPLRVLTKAATHPPQELLKFLGEGEFAPNRNVPLWIANKYCQGPDLYCINPLLFLSGGIPEENSWSKSLAARVLYHVPAGGSTGTILHFAELVKTGKFHKFNAATREFPLNHVTVPIALFSSNDDWLATKADVLRLYFSIANPIDHYVIQGTKLTHTDFVWHPEADNILFSRVVDSLKNDLNVNISRRNEVK